MADFFEQVVIVGVGLIGGSLAISARARGLFGHITGVGRTKDNLLKAQELGVIDDYSLKLTEVVGTADLVVLAPPVGSIVPCLEEILPFLKDNAIVTDVGSVKGEIMRKIDALSISRVHFVGGHPIAGTENSGVEAAFGQLFEHRVCILTPTDKTDPLALERVRNMWSAIGAEVVLMHWARHDRILAAVSHLPHMIAFALVNMLGKENDEGESIFRYSAGGLRDFTRIAGSHPVMWKDIALMNRGPLVEVIERYQKELDRLKASIAAEDSHDLINEFQRGRDIRRNIM